MITDPIQRTQLESDVLYIAEKLIDMNERLERIEKWTHRLEPLIKFAERWTRR